MSRSELDGILLTEGDIARRVAELGKAISAAYGTTPLTVVGILKGGLIFVADLLRRIESPTTLELIQASSYGDATTPQSRPRIRRPRGQSFTGRQVLLVDDIVDSGATLDRIRGELLAQRPAGLRICVLLDKPSRRRVPVPLDWTGFEVPDRFVVGYGLDYQERYRGLPYLACLAPR